MLVQAILSFKPAVIFRVGDLVDNGNDPKLWEVFNEIHGPLLNTTEYFPCLGNHESDSPLYFKNFANIHNRRWYSVDRRGIHFVVLDSNSRLDLESEQYKWLELDLAAVEDKTEFIILLFHHPLFDVSKNHASDEKKLRQVLFPLIEKYGVSAVFSGHSHDYQRFEYKGTYFIVSGGGGSRLYGQARADPYLQKFSMAYHFCLLSAQDGFLNVKVIDIDSKVIDDFKIPARSVHYIAS